MAATFGLSTKLIFQRTIPQFRNACKPNVHVRRIHKTYPRFSKEPDNQLMVRPSMFDVPNENKNKDTFLEAIKIYTTRAGPRRGQVEFIYSALKYMEEFGAHKDLQAYKDILDVLPKGTYIPTNMFQAEFFHYPKQQQCVLDLLEQMEDFGGCFMNFKINLILQLDETLITIMLWEISGVMPDAEMERMVLNIFGRHGWPTKKLLRMCYWMPKFKNLSPWALPKNIPKSNLEIAKLAIKRMGSVDPASEMEVFQSSDLKDAIDDTWIVSGQSPKQRELLAKLKEKHTVYVEGAFTIWLRTTSINYFILRTDPVPLTEEEVKQRAEFDYDGRLRAVLPIGQGRLSFNIKY